MDHPGRYQEDRYDRREQRNSSERYELTNNGRHFKTFTKLGDSDQNHDVNDTFRSEQHNQYHSSPTSQNQHPNDDPEEYTGNLEELNPKTMEFDRLVELMHPKFLSDYLERILIFLKGGNKEICFPNIAPFKEAFLVKLVTDRNNLYSDSFDGTCRSLCRDILSTLDRNRNVFKWVHAYESGIVSKSVLVYQKQFINKRQDIRESSRFKVPQRISMDRLSRGNSVVDLDDDTDYGRNSHDNMSQPDQEPDDVTCLGDMSRRQRNYKALFDSVTHAFIMSSLHTIADFVEDDTRTTLKFPNMDSEQARFLKTVNSFPFKRALYSLLGGGCGQLVRRLRAGCGNHRIGIAEGRARRRDKLRDVEIKKKVPKAKTRAKEEKNQRRAQERSNASSRCNSRQDDHRQRGGDYNPRDMFLKALSVSTDSEDSADVTDKLDSVRSQESDPHSSRDRRTDDRGKGNNARYSSTGINWQPAIDDSPTAPVADRGRKAVRHGKLAAALAVPVEADKAMRMMKLMGWQGGALGARGEGITEPIMPALDIVSGAGLGHSPTRKKRERHRETRKDSRTHFRRELLEAVLDLLRRDTDEKEIAFQDKLCKKARAFTRLLVKAFNARQNLGLNSDDEKELVSRILGILNSQPRLALEARISDDWRLVTVTKKTSNQPAPSTSSRRKRKKHSITVTEPDDSDDDDSRLSDCQVSGDTVTASDIDNLLKRLGKSKNASRRALIALAYRIIFLKKLLNFVSSKQLEQTISFQDILNSRQCKFIENMVLMVNKREKAGYSTKTENELYTDIKNKVDCYLKVKFSDAFRTICLQKKYYTKRFINTSTSGSGSREQRETELRNNNNDDKRHSDNRDEDDEDLEEYEKRIEDMIILSDSDNSVVSLECDYEVLDEDNDSNDKIRDITDDKSNGDVIDLDTIAVKDENLVDWNETADNSDDKNVEAHDHCKKIATGEDGREIVDETNDRDVVTIGTPEKLRDKLNVDNKVTDVTSEIVLSDKRVVINYYKNDKHDQMMIVENDKASDSSDSNTGNADSEDNNDKSMANAELDRQIKNLDTLKLENNPVIMEVKSLAAEIKNELTSEESDVVSCEFEVNNEKGQDINALTTTHAETVNSKFKADIPTRVDENQVEICNGETQRCMIGNALNDKNGAQDLGDKTEYVSDLSPGSSKRSRTESEGSETQMPKKQKIQYNEVNKAIVPSDPEVLIDKEIACKIQENMLKTIEETNELPLLKCDGIINGKLLYKCQDEYSLKWLENFVSNLKIEQGKFKLIDSSEEVVKRSSNKIKMAAKINSYLPENAQEVFKRIELYNTAVNTTKWVVLKQECFEGFYVFTLDIDYESYRVIESCRFALYAAIDKIEFSRVWE